jgi:hypothetical protein
MTALCLPVLLCRNLEGGGAAPCWLYQSCSSPRHRVKSTMLGSALGMSGLAGAFDVFADCWLPDASDRSEECIPCVLEEYPNGGAAFEDCRSLLAGTEPTPDGMCCSACWLSFSYLGSCPASFLLLATITAVMPTTAASSSAPPTPRATPRPTLAPCDRPELLPPLLPPASPPPPPPPPAPDPWHALSGST